ncbi:DUF885 domain-containing protein [Gulosibacter macacae]|uniref:DUF885 domain-containing protein n=1 Tax=Gulosibacter macacae TaxID=2488791 RepID=A0A3P3VYW3_9MICO|nr:DUF885 domain-containing protein [Gulosibacter macacae]RRJ87258.1 DUF885 domain-containing protein [Gulosibacter macacae]
MTDVATPNPNPASRPHTALDRLAERWLDTQVELNPAMRIDLGRPGDQAEYGDYSPAGLEARRAATATTLREVADTPVTDEVDAVTAAELTRTLELDLELLDAGEPLREMNNLATVAHEIRMVFDLMPQETSNDFVEIARRLANVPEAVAGYAATLREGMRRGMTPAVRQVNELATQAADYGRADGMFAGLANSAPDDASPALRTDLAKGAAAAAEAYAGLASFLREELAPVATEQDAVGRDRYALYSRLFLGAAVDLDDSYEWGLAELDRMRREQEAVAAEIAPGRTVAEVADLLDRDPRYRLEGTAALQAWMQERSDAAVNALAGSEFAITPEMRQLECRIAPTQDGGIYYTGPSDDFTRPGRMWWSVPEGVTEFSTWRELTTVYHEGVPGHHLQIATSTAEKATLNAWRRVNWCSGHGEGWALYAESLMDELGFLDEPAYRFGMLDAQRMRAARVVLDLGMHLGKPMPGTGDPWTFERAIEFFTGEVNMDAPSIHFEVTRYFGWPGQAPSYKLGQRIWEDLRAEAARVAGPDFDLAAWHERALRLGTVGLDTLRQQLSR